MLKEYIQKQLKENRKTRSKLLYHLDKCREQLENTENRIRKLEEGIKSDRQKQIFTPRDSSEKIADLQAQSIEIKEKIVALESRLHNLEQKKKEFEDTLQEIETRDQYYQEQEKTLGDEPPKESVKDTDITEEEPEYIEETAEEYTEEYIEEDAPLQDSTEVKEYIRLEDIKVAAEPEEKTNGPAIMIELEDADEIDDSKEADSREDEENVSRETSVEAETVEETPDATTEEFVETSEDALEKVSAEETTEPMEVSDDSILKASEDKVVDTSEDKTDKESETVENESDIIAPLESEEIAELSDDSLKNVSEKEEVEEDSLNAAESASEEKEEDNNPLEDDTTEDQSEEKKEEIPETEENTTEEQETQQEVISEAAETEEAIKEKIPENKGKLLQSLSLGLLNNIMQRINGSEEPQNTDADTEATKEENSASEEMPAEEQNEGAQVEELKAENSRVLEELENLQKKMQEDQDRQIEFLAQLYKRTEVCLVLMNSNKTRTKKELKGIQQMISDYVMAMDKES